MSRCVLLVVILAALVAGGAVLGGMSAMTQEKSESPPPGYDADLARALGADDLGMRSYVLVILKSSATPVAAGPERDAMFRGHFENMKRLSNEGTLVLAGPLDGVDGWRGLFVLAVPDIDAAKRAVAADPVVAKGEMIPEFHRYYGSAALMQVREIHEKIAKKRM